MRIFKPNRRGAACRAHDKRSNLAGRSKQRPYIYCDWRRIKASQTKGAPMTMIKAWAAKTAGGKLEAFEYDPGPLGAEEVEIAV